MDTDWSTWFSATDRETERERIEAFACRQREKCPPEQDQRRPGYERRCANNWQEVVGKIADLHSRIEDGEGTYARWPLGFRILLLTWPIVMPYSIAKRLKMSRRQVERSRDKLAKQLGFPGFMLLAMLSKQAIGDRDYFNVPLISIRHRKKPEWKEHAWREVEERNRGHDDEVIGRAVVAEYRKHSVGRRSLEAAKIATAAQNVIDGITVRKIDNVTKQYLRYRKAAHDRGYADSRAFWAEYHNEPWPEDQIWLDDFPPASG